MPDIQGAGGWRKVLATRSLARNATLNVFGTIAPMAVAVAVVPILLTALGKERLGLFTLALALFGFAGLFDLGLGRALTRTVAQYTGSGRSPSETASIVRVALGAVAGLGLLWAGITYTASDWMVAQTAILDPAVVVEARRALVVLAWLMPVVLLSGALVGVLEGLQEFGTVNAVRVPLGVATYVAPAIAAVGSGDLAHAVGALALVRVAGLMAWLHLAHRRVPFLVATAPATGLGELWRYSGWLTVSNTIGPLMVSADRYFLAATFPPAAIANYTVPFDTIYRLTAFPSAALNAVFPAIASQGQGREALSSLVSFAGRGAAVLWLAPLVLVGVYMEELLALWLGSSFAQEAHAPARWIAAGVLINGFALIPHTVLQGVGRSDITAKFHLLELPFYAFFLLLLTAWFGVLGAAIAWGLRVAMDAILLLAAAIRLHPGFVAQWLGLAVLPVLGAMIVFAPLALPGWPRGVWIGALLALVLWQYRGLIRARREDRE